MTYTTLNLGTPKFKRRLRKRVVPFAVSPCVEPGTISGTNILTDPGFENHLAETGGGPLGDSIPYDWSSVAGSQTEPDSGLLWPTASNPASSTWPDAPATSGWFAYYVTLSQNWEISSASPRSGTYHARWTKPSDTNNGLGLQPYGFSTCEGGFVVTGRINPGDYVRWLIWAKSSSASNAALQIHINYFNSAFGSVGSNSSSSTGLGTSYASIQVDGIAPANTYYLLTEIANTSAGALGTGATIDIDDCELEVS